MHLGPLPSLAIVGTGLIGASLGLAVRRRQPDAEIVGVDARPEAAHVALRRGALTQIAPSVAAAVRGADVVVLAAPLDRIPALLTEATPHLRDGALVTDVGSVKGGVMAAAASALPPTARFVGGHPMAGAAAGGPEHAEVLLFENAAYVLTPPSGVDDLPTYAPEALALVAAVGARAVVMDANRHDRVAATVSHLPQLLAVALVETAVDAGSDALGLAAGGFRDMTRIAGSPFGMWGPILSDNRDDVARVLGGFIDRLLRIRQSVATAPGTLAASFDRAAQARAALPTSTKGFLAPLADVVVWADDRPGFLHGLTGVVADAGLNLKDAELLRVREGEVGTFRFGFESPADADRACAAFASAGYRAERR